jgi:hypothetical protein
MRSLLTFGALVVLGGCAIIVTPNDDVHVQSVFSSKTVVGDGRLAHERRDVATVAALEVSGPLEVNVRVGAAPALEVEADSNLLPLIRSEVSGGTLRLWIEGNVRSEHSLRVNYSVPQLTQIRSTGSGHLTVSELNGAPLAINKTGSGAVQLSGRVGSLEVQQTGSGQLNATALQSGNANLTVTGSGRLSVGQLRADTVTINVTGSGTLQASGVADSVNVHVHGSGGADLAGLTSQQADLSTTGSGDITAIAQRSLVAQGSGSGRITVYGNPAQRDIRGKHVQVLN